MGLWIAVCSGAGVLSYIACRWATAVATNAGMIAHPGERQSHLLSTPTGGGLGLMLSILVTAFCLQWFLPLPDFWWQKMLPGIIPLVLVGWRDDKVPVSEIIRILVQLAVSLWLLGFGWSEFSLKDTAFYIVAMVAMVWMMNLYNFMDGSNGMAGFQGVFAGMMMALLFQDAEQPGMALLALAVAAACAGFLPLNFPRARVFMGDVASVPLGFIFASLAVYGMQTGSFSLSISVLIMSVFIVDATSTLLTRVFRGERWYTAHAKHVYQRLIAQGWSHSRVLLAYQAVNVILVIPAIVLAKMYPQFAVITAGLTLSLLGVCWQIANWRLGMIATVQSK